MIRYIPFSFRNKDFESMLYLNFKAGPEGIIFYHEDIAFYSSISIGGSIGWTPGIQLGASAGYEHCVFDNITFVDNNGNTETLADTSGNVSLDASSFFIQVYLGCNF